MDLVVLGAQGRVLVGAVIVNAEISQVLDRSFPKYTPSVRISRAEAVDALDKRTATDDLLGRAMAVTRQYIHVGTSAKPQHA